MNMYSDNRIDLGTEGNRPTIQGVQDFLLDFSNMIDREVGGYYVSLKGKDSIKYITIGNISRNTPRKAYPGSPYKALSSLPDYNPNQWNHSPRRQTLSEDVIDAMYRHHYVDTLVNQIFWPDDVIDDGRIGVQYLFSKKI